MPRAGGRGSPGPPSGVSDFVVVANRLPVDQVTDPDGTTRWQRSPGGLVTALEPSCAGRARRLGRLARLGRRRTGAVRVRRHVAASRCALSEDEVDRYYEGFSNATLWPLYHDVVVKPEYHRALVGHLRRRSTSGSPRPPPRAAAEGAIVWVHDYQLQLVPGDAPRAAARPAIGFFLHIPFPPYELFMQLPWRTAIVEGLLGADLVGFQRPAARRTSSGSALPAARPAGRRRADAVGESSTTAGRSRVGAFPISIDSPRSTSWPAPRRRPAPRRGDPRGARQPAQDHPGRRPAGLHQGHRRAAGRFDELLEEGRVEAPRHRAGAGGHAQPRAGRALQCTCARTSSSRSATSTACTAESAGPAVHYFNQSMPREELAALYRAGRRHARHAVPRRDEPGGQGVRRVPRRPRRRAGAVGVRRRRRRARSRPSWSTRTTSTASRTRSKRR